MPLIIGLGNPGEEYQMTRHNLGFLVIDELAEQLHAKWSNDASLRSEIAEMNIDGEKIILAKPQTFMNKSGEAVQLIANKFNIPTSDIWVIYDDVALPFGLLRTRLEGSAGGHNGIKSLIQSLGAEDFIRIRVGIGENPENIPLDKWVLGRFPKECEEELNHIIDKAAGLIQKSLQDGIVESMTENLGEIEK